MRWLGLLLLLPLAVFGADVGVSGLTCSADAPASVTVDSGSDRHLIYIIGEERTGSPGQTVSSIGGQAPTETLSFVDAALDQDHHHIAYVWNESAIGSMSGTSVSASGAATTDQHCYLTVTEADQAAFAGWTDTDSSLSTTSLTLTTTSNAGDFIIANGIKGKQASETFTSWSPLTEQDDTQTASQRHGLAYAQAGASDDSVTVQVSGSANELSAAALVIPDAGGSALSLIRKRRW